ncbi:MAG: ArsR family transcriptional regulator [Nitrososphaerota archaeon]|nr:ArsR family transcriptional regulator [Nitrososphaerota archaeon]MCL5672061.1 ArsR family transcriptional regulator [Nitrososphaerota archaeon]MDG6903660.1 ArsR family transcriptional regulator [Nitrososphaerota archaeon]MDG6912013.1 ArsR family transcriptional regulator [Nitrososphaerota archaeon]MDG6924509.1 ArsR family transcriptional regulator [Nitrososphaerota archaeon]
MSQAELDAVLGTVENPIRRMIISRISEEPNYQLQLSKELKISQQLVAKHLMTMERAGLVSTVSQDSPRGPQRKEYMLKSSFSVTVDLAPNLFRTRIFSFGALPGVAETDEHAQMMTQISGVLRYPDGASRIHPLTHVVAEVDRKLKAMEEERAVLLYIRSLALREAARIGTSLPMADRKRVVRYLMREEGDGVEAICSSLGLEKQVVCDILEEIEKEIRSLD